MIRVLLDSQVVLTLSVCEGLLRFLEWLGGVFPMFWEAPEITGYRRCRRPYGRELDRLMYGAVLDLRFLLIFASEALRLGVASKPSS